MHVSTRIAGGILSCCLMAVAPQLAICQAAAPPKPAVGTPIAPAKVYGKLLTAYEQEFVSLVEAMPEDKFNFAPAASMGEYKGVRTFAEQVKHVTEANLYYFHDPSQSIADQRAAVEKLQTKAEIVQALKDSFTTAHAFVDAITPENAFLALSNGSTRAGQAAGGIAHMMDHYGQLVEYLRMNGMVPPASRGNM